MDNDSLKSEIKKLRHEIERQKIINEILRKVYRESVSIQSLIRASKVAQQWTESDLETIEQETPLPNV